MQLSQKIEAILFFKGEPVSIKRLCEILKVSKEEIGEAIIELNNSLKERGIVLLEKGDELHLTYSYEVPYYINFEQLTSFRIFFNNTNYIKNYSLHIFHENGLNIFMKYYNDAKPDSTVKSDKGIDYYWGKSNLFGNIDYKN